MSTKDFYPQGRHGKFWCMGEVKLFRVAGWSVLGIFCLAFAACGDSVDRKNILLIIMDDVGQDQLAVFNPISLTPPSAPNIEAVAASGVLFSQAMATPECSPSRAAIFTGRYPFRTGVTAAILNDDQPRAQVSPFEMTTPKVLRTAGYKSAMFGKFHLGGPENNPDGNLTPTVLGWDYYDGNLQGGPPFIDNTLGGQYQPSSAQTDNAGDPFSCGFPLGETRGGCWRRDSEGAIYFDSNGGSGYTGKECIEIGGIAAVDAAGKQLLDQGDCPSCEPPDFETFNGYFVCPRVINQGGEATPVGIDDYVYARTYMATAQADAAIEWINQKSAGGDPWMATLSFDSIHTPYQPPPDHLYPRGFEWPAGVSQDCGDLGAQRVLSNLMAAAMDREIGRVLVETGLATLSPEGSLVYDPEKSDTIVVLVGDNGTFYPGVKFPYNLVRSKGTPFETGVLVPLIVAGPEVDGGGRTVDALVNIVDLFQLFGDIAGVDVDSVVPPEHKLDSVSMVQYLDQSNCSGSSSGGCNFASEREFNFTQLGDGLKKTGVEIYPCVLTLGESIATCTDILFTSDEICVEYGGEYFGPPSDNNQSTSETTYQTCCDVKNDDSGMYGELDIIPTRVWGIRNDTYKLVVQEWDPYCDNAPASGPCEFYDLSPQPRNPVNPLGLDNEPSNLLARRQLTPLQQANLIELKEALVSLLASEADCPGDGNLDKRVNELDLEGIRTYWGEPSVFDFNDDGTTNQLDEQIVRSNLGAECVPPGTVDLPSCVFE
jgi:hypothetical protein